MTTIEAPRIYPTFRYLDPAAAHEWLTGVIGFKEIACYRDGDTIAHAELAFGSSMIMIGQHKDDKFAAIVGVPSDQGGKAVYVAVEDVDALFEKVSRTKTVIEEKPTDRDYGSREFTCRDPEGNVWVFGTYWPKAGES